MKLESRKRVYTILPSDNSTKNGMIRDQNSELFIPLKPPPINKKVVQKEPNIRKKRLADLRYWAILLSAYLVIVFVVYVGWFKDIFPIGLIWRTVLTTVIILVLVIIMVVRFNLLTY